MSYVFKHFLDKYSELAVLGIIIEHVATVGTAKPNGSERELGKIYHAEVHGLLPKNVKFRPTTNELNEQATDILKARYENVDGISGKYDKLKDHIQIGYLLSHYPRDTLEEIKQKLPSIAAELSLSNNFKVEHRSSGVQDAIKIEVNGIEKGLLFLDKVEDELQILKS